MHTVIPDFSIFITNNNLKRSNDKWRIRLNLKTNFNVRIQGRLLVMWEGMIVKGTNSGCGVSRQ